MTDIATGTAARTQYLSFRLKEETYGIDVRAIREILELPDITAIPKMPTYFKGVINLRGKVVPVIDLRQKLEMEHAENTENTCIVVLDLTVENEVVFIGILVDEVEEVLELDIAAIEPAPSIGSKMNVDFLEGIGKSGDSFLMILNYEKLLSIDDLENARELSKSN